MCVPVCVKTSMKVFGVTKGLSDKKTKTCFLSVLTVSSSVDPAVALDM